MGRAIAGGNSIGQRYPSPKGRKSLLAFFTRGTARLCQWVLGWPHVWILVAMLVAGGALYYLDLFIATEQGSLLGPTAGHMSRVILMVPVMYGGFVLGPRASFFALVAITLVMLTGDVLHSSQLPRALLETASVVLVSGVVILLASGQQKEKHHREEAAATLEVARQELRSHIEMITKHEKQLSAIHEVCRVIASSLDLPYVLERILDRTSEVMAVPVALMFLKDNTGEWLELMAHKGVSENFVRAAATVRVGEGFNGRVALSGEPMIISNSLEDPRLHLSQVRAEGLESQLIVPLRSKGQTIGTLCVAVRTSRCFSPEDVELLAALGSQVGIAIENARLYREALTSQEKYRDLFENATVAIFVHDLDGTITAANTACTHLTGYPLAAVIGMDMRRLFPPGAFQILEDVEHSLLQGKAITEPCEVQMHRRDGAERVLSMTTRLISQNGQPSSFQHIAEDVTERRQVRETLNDYIRRVLTAQEDERKRIARELHDETTQSLLLISQRLDALASDPRKGLTAEAMASLEGVRGVVLTTLADLRRLTQDLRPRILDDLGLVAALEWLADELQAQTGLQVSVDVGSAEQPIRFEVQLLLFRIAQEALSNVRRHAAASRVRITLEQEGNRVCLAIQDNGKGFHLPPNLAALAAAGKLGILGMHERAKLLNGTVTVHSEPGQGTAVVAELPL